MATTLEIYGGRKGVTQASFKTRVENEMENWLKKQARNPFEIVELVIRRDDVIEWKTIFHKPIIQCFGDDIEIDVKEIEDNPSIKISAAVTGRIEKISPKEFRMKIHSGSVQLTTTNSFERNEDLFATRKLKDWLKKLWSKDNRKVAGIIFGNEQFELELLETNDSDTKHVRHRESLTENGHHSRLLKATTLEIHSQNEMSPASFEISVNDKMAAWLETASLTPNEVVPVVIGQKEVTEWGNELAEPLLIIHVFGHNVKLLQRNIKDDVQVSASVTGKINKLGERRFSTKIESGSVRIVKKDSFSKQYGKMFWKPFCMPWENNECEEHKAKFEHWLSDLWNEKDRVVTGIFFGRKDFELELVDTKDPLPERFRRRVSLIIKDVYSELWQLSSCNTSPEHLAPQNVLDDFSKRVVDHLSSFGFGETIQRVARRGRTEQNPGVFYRRPLQGNTSVQTLVRPDFGLLFTDGRKGELTKTWYPETLRDDGEKLVLHQHDEVQPGYALRLISVATDEDLIDTGKSLVVVAFVGPALHVRIFDTSGKMAVDKTESQLVSGKVLVTLKEQLTRLPDEANLSQQTKHEIICNAALIAGHSMNPSAQKGAPIDLRTCKDVAPDARIQFTGSNMMITEIKTPELQCAGIRTGRLQDGKLWQFGTVTPKPSCLPEPMAVWTRFEIPDRTAVRPPSDAVLLPLPLMKSLKGWQLNLGIDASDTEQELSPLLRMTLTLGAVPSLELELFDGPVTLFSPELQTYASRLQDPTSPPNAKQLKESLRATRLVFSETNATDVESEDDRQPTITIPAQDQNEPPVFQLQAENDALVSYPPHARDAGINYLSAGAKNLRQCVDTVTLRTIVERDTTHLLTPFPITSCRLAAGKVASLQEVKWKWTENKDQAPHIAAAMALAPWVSMQDSVAADIDDPTTRVRSLHHRNLALEHGEFAAASLDRAADGMPHGLAESVEDFVKATRDEYTIAVESLPDSKSAAEEVGNWLPGAELTNTPKVWIDYRDATDGVDRAPIVHSDAVFSQKLHIRTDQSKRTLGERWLTDLADGTHMDWLTCNAKLTEIRTEVDNRPRPVVQLEPVDTNSQQSVTRGFVRARNGSVPCLFDGKDFSAVALDSSSQPSGTPLGWYVAGSGSGVAVHNRGTGIVEEVLAGASINPVRVGTGQTTGADWVVALQPNGALQSWQRQSGTDIWKLLLNTTTAGFSVTASAVASSGTSVAVLATDSSSNQLRLWIWRPNPASDTPDFELVESVAALDPASVVDLSLLFVDDELFVAAATEAPSPSAYRGTRDNDGSWTFALLQIKGADVERPTRSIALAYFNPQHDTWIRAAEPWHSKTEYTANDQFAIWISPTDGPFIDKNGRMATEGSWNAAYPSASMSGEVFDKAEAKEVEFLESTPRLMLATVADSGRQWCLAEFATHLGSGEFHQIDAVPIPDSVEATDICLATRPDSNQGLPPGCRPGWVIVANDSGSIDLWLSTSEPSLRSVDPNLSAQLSKHSAKQPLLRLNGHPGMVKSLDSSFVNVDGPMNLRSGLLSCGGDGAIRLWNVDTASMLHQVRADAVWMDNLSTLRAPQVDRRGNHSWTQQVNRPLGVSMSRSEPYQYAPQCSSISLSIGHSDDSLLVRTGQGTSRLTEIFFSCESLRLLLDNSSGTDVWKPEPVQGDKAETFFAASRGYAGVFGFYSNVKGSAVEAADYLPRVAGVPMFFRDIDSIIFWGQSDKCKRGEDPWRFMSISVTAVLINPLLLDGSGATLEDIRQGDAPSFLNASVQDQSLVTVEMVRCAYNDIMHIADVRSLTGKNITWNMLVGDEPTAASTDGFRGRMEQLSFTVEFDRPTHRILLTVIPENSEARLLEGSQPLDGAANAQLVLEGYEGVEACGRLLYGFETLRAPKADDAGSLPLKVCRPYHRFKDVPAIAHLAADAIGRFGDIVTSHGDKGKAHEIRWWDASTGLHRNQFLTEAAVSSLAYGRCLTALGLFPNRDEDSNDPLGVALHEVLTSGTEQLKALRIPNSSTPVSVACVVSDNSQSLLVVGDEAGRIHLMDAVTRKLHGVVELAADAVEALVVAANGDKLIAAALCDGKVWLLDAKKRRVLEELSLEGAPAKLVSQVKVGDSLWIFAASDKKIRGWKWDGSIDESHSISEDVSTHTVQSIAIGHSGDIPVLFYTASDGILRKIDTTGTTSRIGNSLLGTTAIDFFVADDDTHLLAAATAGAQLKVFLQKKTADTWSDWKVAVTGNDLLPVSTGQVRFVRSADSLLIVASPANHQVDVETTYDVHIYEVSIGSASSVNRILADASKRMPAGSRWFSAVEAGWMPHCATCNGTDIDLYNLVSGSRTHWFTVNGDGPVQQLAFAATESDTWLIAACATTAHSLRLSGAPEQPRTLSHQGDINDLGVSGPYAVVAGNGITFWEIGIGESDANHRLKFAEGEALQHVAVTHPECSETKAKVAAGGDGLCISWELNFDSNWSQTERHRFTSPSFSTLDYIRILSKDHLCLSRNDSGQIDILLPDEAPGTQAVTRWQLSASAPAPRVAVNRHSTLALFVGGGTDLSIWSPNQLLSFDEQGHVTAQLDVDLKLNSADTGFGVAAQILETGQARFLKHNDSFTEINPLLAGLSRHGMFCLIGDCNQPDKVSGSTALVFHREVTGIAGTAIQSTFISSEISVTVEGSSYTFNHIAELTQQMTRTFVGQKSRTDRLISGRLRPARADQSRFEIHFADQVVRSIGESKSMLGMLWLEHRGRLLQGPVLCGMGMLDDKEQVEVKAGVFRVVPSRFESDSLPWDYAFPACGDLQYLDFAIPVPANTSADGRIAEFVQFSGTEAGIQLRKIGQDRIPLNLCMDSAQRPISVVNSVITQLAHRRGLGRRIRFAQDARRLFQSESTTEWGAARQDGIIWQMMPLLSGDGGLQLMDAGVIMQDSLATPKTVATENVLAVLRPAAADEPTVVCLGSETGVPDESEDLVRADSFVDAVNRRILLRQTLRDDGLPVYSVVAGQSVATAGLRVPQRLSAGATLPGADSRLLLHAAARRVLLDGRLERQLLPGTSNPKLDNGLTAVRELQLQLEDQHRSVERVKVKETLSRSMWVQEATAFRDMKRPWYQPESLNPWVESLPCAIGNIAEGVTNYRIFPGGFFIYFNGGVPVFGSIQKAITVDGNWKSSRQGVNAKPFEDMALKFDGRNLRLMSVTTTDDLSKEGHSLVIVAYVNTELYIRIFDASGKVVDKNELPDKDKNALTRLLNRLDAFSDESNLSLENKYEIIKHATSIASHTQFDKENTGILMKVEGGIPHEMIDGEVVTVNTVFQQTLKEYSWTIKRSAGNYHVTLKENESKFHPSSFRFHLAPDKPGAMIHHRLQLAQEQPSKESSSVDIFCGPQLSFAMREPMQLNPPVGSSFEITGSPTLSKPDEGPWHHLEFKWKEILGTIPVRVSGDVMIAQVSSQSDGVLAKDVKIELKKDTSDCLQLIVQLNDQLIDMDRSQPLFPVYDARRAALATLQINEDHDRLLLDELNLETKVLDIDVLPLAGEQLIAASGDKKTRVWSSHDVDNPIIKWDEKTILRLGWWAGQPVALTGRGSCTRLFDPFQNNAELDNVELKELKADSSSVDPLALEITRINLSNEKHQFDVAVALASDRLHVWVVAANQDTIEMEPKHGTRTQGGFERLVSVESADRQTLMLVLWSPGKEDVAFYNLTIDGSSVPVLSDPISVEIGQNLTALAVTLGTDGSALPSFYVGRNNGSLAVFDGSGTLQREITLTTEPLLYLHAISEGGRPLVVVTTGNNTVSVLDGRTLSTLRYFVQDEHGVGYPRSSGKLVHLGEPVLVCTGGVDLQTVQLYRVGLSTIRPGNIFLLTKAYPTREEAKQNVFEPVIKVRVKDVDDADAEYRDVPLKAKLVLLDIHGMPISGDGVELSKCFTEQSSNKKATLYEFDPKSKGLSFNGAAAVRLEWAGKIEKTNVTIYAKFDRDHGLRLLPFSATASKMSAVISLDKPDEIKPKRFNQIMQRNLLFGDSATPSKGKGVLQSQFIEGQEVVSFAFEVEEHEKIDTPLPVSFTDDWRMILTCAKYHIDGQLTGHSKIVKVNGNNTTI